MKGRAWTVYEDRVLFRLAEIKTAKELGELLNRTEAAVFSHLQYLRKKGFEVYLMKFGFNNHSTKHDAHTVELCRQLHDEGLPPRVIAEKLELREATVEDWCYYKCRRTLG